MADTTRNVPRRTSAKAKQAVRVHVKSGRRVLSAPMAQHSVRMRLPDQQLASRVH